MIRLHQLDLEFPEGFSLLSEEEIALLNINETGDENFVLRDENRHTIASLAYRRVNALFLAVLTLKEIVEKNEKETADLMRSFAYHREAFLERGEAMGFAYSYEVQGRRMYGMSFNRKGKKGIYHLHFYMREEEKEERSRLVEEILSSVEEVEGGSVL
jgi:hypothetical protein